MRTTLEIDDDVFFHVRQVAASERTSIGKTLSRFLRDHFQAAAAATPATGVARNGFAVIPSADRVVSLETIQKLMDDEGI
jgi:negative regulator of replication initiation